ncbi:MAG: hypothetical protein GVY11_04155 [Gammaproteobacteria bacterium]|jgi:hypothetical protein|nr:hypothetical protein [Gammaproteobacteria bacterium]
MIRFVLLACALVVPFWASASDEPVPLIETEPYVELARWMVEQPDPEMRAVGLVALAENRASGAPAIEPARFLEAAEGLLADEPSGAVAYMLARGCAAAGLIERCEDIGVRKAIDDVDGGNPLAAGVFHQSGSKGYRDMLVDAAHVDDHYPEQVSAWYAALRARPWENLSKGVELVTATSFAQAGVVPVIDELTRTCRSAVGSDATLDRACQRLSERMRTAGRTILLRNIGYGLARHRAETLGDEERVRQFRRHSEVVTKTVQCLSDSAHRALSSDIDTQRRFLSDLRADGEVAAFQALIDEYGSSCPARQPGG